VSQTIVESPPRVSSRGKGDEHTAYPPPWSMVDFFQLATVKKFRICNMVGCVCASAGLTEIPVASGVFTCCEFLMLSPSALRADGAVSS